jgi:hypothetical protein
MHLPRQAVREFGCGLRIYGCGSEGPIAFLLRRWYQVVRSGSNDSGLDAERMPE